MVTPRQIQQDALDKVREAAHLCQSAHRIRSLVMQDALDAGCHPADVAATSAAMSVATVAYCSDCDRTAYSYDGKPATLYHDVDCPRNQPRDPDGAR